MTLQQCRYVLEVGRSGSFNEAAKNLFVAQTSISSAIRALEEELDINIFKRTPKGAILTDEGAEFIEYASHLVSQAKLIDKRYKNPSGVKKMHISTQHYDFIAEIFGRFLNNNSDGSFSFSVKETKTYEVIEDVERNSSNIGIIAIKMGDGNLMERYLSQKNLVFTPLLKTYPHVFLRRNHPLAKKKSIARHELCEYPYISYKQGEYKSSFFVEELSEMPESEKNLEITDRATLMNFLLLSDSYTIGTGIMNSKLNSGNIVSVPLQSHDIYTIGYILREDTKPSTYTREFIRELIKFSKEASR